MKYLPAILLALLLSLSVRADTIDLAQWQNNDSGSDCVHASIVNLLRIAGLDKDADAFWQRYGHTGEDSPPGLAAKLESMGIKYWQGQGSKEILLKAVKDGRGAAVGMGGKHMLNVIGGDQENVVIRGNMNARGNKTEPWSEFLGEFDGWTVILTGTHSKPARPVTGAGEAVSGGKVKPTDWPYCCCCEITNLKKEWSSDSQQMVSAGGSGTLVGISGDTGVVATCAHVFENGGKSASLTFPDGYKCKGTVLARDAEIDLVAISIPVKAGMTTTRGIRAATAADKFVLAVGYPFYCHGIPHWTVGPYVGYQDSDVRFKARPFIHSGYSGGMLIGTDGCYLGSTNGYGETYSYAASGKAMVQFFSQWVKAGAK